MVDKTKESQLLKFGFGVWMTLCVMLCLWFFKTFTTGRSQFQTNLHVIEEGLKNMQDTIELRQRQKSMGYTEDMEDISDFMKKFHEAKYEDKPVKENLNKKCEESTVQESNSDDSIPDKKNL